MKARVAFMQLVNAAQRTLATKIEALDPDNQYEWQKAEELRYSFMNVVVAAANRFEIETFHSMGVPQNANFRDGDHRQHSWNRMSFCRHHPQTDVEYHADCCRSQTTEGETKQLPAMAQSKALSAPRKPAPPVRASGFSDDLDDDVPF
jgi:hypothetical protein